MPKQPSIDEARLRDYALRQMDRRDSRDDGDQERKRLERILPELLKRLVEASLGKIAEGPGNIRQLMSEFKLPKDALLFLLSQVDDTKNGLYRVTAREIRDFLEHTDFAEQFAKVLTMLSFEVKMEVRFVPNDSRAGIKPSIKSRVKIKRKSNADREPESETKGSSQRSVKRHSDSEPTRPNPRQPESFDKRNQEPGASKRWHSPEPLAPEQATGDLPPSSAVPFHPPSDQPVRRRSVPTQKKVGTPSGSPPKQATPNQEKEEEE